MHAPSPGGAGGNTLLGAFGPEGQRLREQLWIVPSGSPDQTLRATMFRPAEDGRRHPLLVINHGTSDLTRESVSMPVYYWMSRWFVQHGYVVLLPQRRGHGATGGALAESVGTCADPDHARSGEIAADDIAAAIRFASAQPFIEPGKTVVVGISTGGWASLALAARNPAGVRAVVNFAGGRGGHAQGKANAVCGKARLIEAAGRFGAAARVPTLWLYAENDSYFDPRLAGTMARAWAKAGGAVEMHALSPYGSEGHELAQDRAGVEVWAPLVERFLDGETDQVARAARPAPEPEDDGVIRVSVGAQPD